MTMQGNVEVWGLEYFNAIGIWKASGPVFQWVEWIYNALIVTVFEVF